jgi:hypothetical protein
MTEANSNNELTTLLPQSVSRTQNFPAGFCSCSFILHFFHSVSYPINAAESDDYDSQRLNNEIFSSLYEIKLDEIDASTL